MQLSEENIRLIFGLKIKQLRSKKGLSLQELSKQSGLSISYLNEIEKGKKYPKTDKIVALAKSLSIKYDQLVSIELKGNLAPITAIFESKIVQELPLELFGLDKGKLIELIADAPEKINAFLSTFVEIARTYDLSENEFYYSALRSLQESRLNYFEEIEIAADEFCQQHKINTHRKLDSKILEKILVSTYQYTINNLDLKKHSPLNSVRYVLSSKNPTPLLLLHPSLTESQKIFVFGKEIAYQYLKLKERSFVSPIIQARSFDMVYNNFKTGYFSSALIINKDKLIGEIKKMVVSKTWNADALMKSMYKFTQSPEMFLHRITNLTSKFFGLHQLFFLRFDHSHHSNEYQLTKELHLTKLHNPHGSALGEHYCRRWLALKVLQEMQEKRKSHTSSETFVKAQISKYHGSDNEYILISAARAKIRTSNMNSSVSIGFQLDKNVKKRLRFWNDPKIPHETVNVTCERCPIPDCKVRAANPTKLEEKTKKRAMIDALVELL